MNAEIEIVIEQMIKVVKKHNNNNTTHNEKLELKHNFKFLKECFIQELKEIGL